MKREAPAAARNRGPIARAIADHLPVEGMVLEVASGTGEHAAHFAREFPDLVWQPSDPDPAALSSIASWRADADLSNIEVPVALDAALPDSWPVRQAAAILCINMIHISPKDASVGLFGGAARILAASAPLILYGPYLEADVPTAPGNLAFDRSLKNRDARWGLRDLAWVDGLARETGFSRIARIAMPANNLTLVYRRQGEENSQK